MDPIGPLVSSTLASSIAPVAPAATAAGKAAGAAGATDFMSALTEALGRVDAHQARAEELARAYQMGDPNVSLESSMVALQEANVSLQFAVQVRNKLVSAYHDVMNMPV